MSFYALDALLLMLFALPVVLQYKILPTETTPYWLFGVLFLILTANVLVSLYHKSVGSISTLFRLKSFFLLATLLIVLGGVVGTSIIDRSHGSPAYGVHDIILQQEAAMRYLIQGKNPYKETYFGTPMEQFHYDELGKKAINPALFHFVMPPWYLLSAFPFYFVTIPLLGYFDGRIPLLFAMLMLLLIVSRWFKNRNIALAAVAILALNPATINYFIEGRSDMFALAWLVAALFYLDRKRVGISSIFFGLAILSKQTIWFALPVYLAYMLKVQKGFKKTFVKSAILISLVCLIIAGPFLIWDSRAFFESVVLFVSGGTSTSYPISGYGLSMILYGLGSIKDTHAYYPFVWWQIVLGLPILIGSLVLVLRKPLMSRLLIGYAVTLGIIWYTSRYFNNSHLAYLSSVFALGVLKDFDEKAS